MEKIAIVVVGEHNAGKSKTVNKYLKHKLNIEERVHKFSYEKCKGYILSQTREERQDFENNISRYAVYDVFILAVRPVSEKKSLFKDTESKLKAMGFEIIVVEISKNQTEKYYENKANEIFAIVSKQCC